MQPKVVYTRVNNSEIEKFYETFECIKYKVNILLLLLIEAKLR